MEQLGFKYSFKLTLILIFIFIFRISADGDIALMANKLVNGRF